MAEELKTYYDFADNNYDFLMAAYKNGLVGNAMGPWRRRHVKNI